MALEDLACHIENIDKDLYTGEDVISLREEELLHEGILTTAIPKRKYKITQKSNTSFGNIDSKSDSVGIPCQIVCENDGSHRCLTCSYTAHEEHLLDLRLFIILPGLFNLLLRIHIIL